MKPNYVVRTYFESILNDDESIDTSILIDSNRSLIKEATGITDKTIDIIEKSLRTRFYYWRKFTRTKPPIYSNTEMQLHTLTNDNIILDQDDIDYIKELCDERIIRLPINSIRWDDEEQTYVTNRERMCDLVGIEMYLRGNFGCDILNIDNPAIFNEYAKYAKDHPDTVRSWAYVNISPRGENLRAY